jgi:uncharacterized protein YbbC (DUF1343 family)
MIEGIDAFIIDLQDIGTRIYTFMYTMANCMKVAAENNKKVIVLDRPNPINGLTLEGNCLEPAFASFVGQYPIIFRHGLTMGELASLFNEEFNLGCDLEIVPLKGWKRNQMADKWGRAWVPPSPNVPNLDSVITFPGTVLFEGTNISEGRGTTKPFEWIGAPYLKPDLLAQHMNSMKFPGVYFRPIFFQPTYQKWKDTVCGGVHIHVSDQKKYSAFKIGIHLLSSMAEMGGEQFQWKKPPYEYENTRMPIDLIAGTDKLRLAIDSGKRLKDLETQSNKDVSAFKKLHKDYCRYKA